MEILNIINTYVEAPCVTAGCVGCFCNLQIQTEVEFKHFCDFIVIASNGILDLEEIKKDCSYQKLKFEPSSFAGLTDFVILIYTTCRTCETTSYNELRTWILTRPHPQSSWVVLVIRYGDQSRSGGLGVCRRGSNLISAITVVVGGNSLLFGSLLHLTQFDLMSFETTPSLTLWSPDPPFPIWRPH